jgi:hypothetical protein
MTIQSLIADIEKKKGNLSRSRNIYISVSNMDCFADQLSEVDAKQGILITPYLIVKNGILYELYYYEFDIEVREDKSYLVDYNKNNTLPIEITEKLKPQAIVAVGDTRFYSEAVNKYLSNMKTMKFEEEKEHYPQLRDAELFYEIIIDSDML